jgi:hypothetical protein
MDPSVGDKPEQPNYIQPGYLTLFSAYIEIGKYLYRDDWTGNEIGIYRSLRDEILIFVEVKGMWDGEPYKPIHRDAFGYGEWHSLLHNDFILIDQYTDILIGADKKSLKTDGNVATIDSNVDIASLSRHKHSERHLRDLLCDKLWSGLMPTEVNPPDISPNSDLSVSSEMATIPHQFWRTDAALTTLFSGRTEGRLGSDTSDCWVMLRIDNLKVCLSDELDHKGISKAKGDSVRERKKAETRIQHGTWIASARQELKKLQDEKNTKNVSVSSVAREVTTRLKLGKSSDTVRKVLAANKADWQ